MTTQSTLDVLIKTENYSCGLTHEAKMLAHRTGLRKEACMKWMRHEGLSSIPDLMHRYPGALHADCMARAAQEIEAFIQGARDG